MPTLLFYAGAEIEIPRQLGHVLCLLLNTNENGWATKRCLCCTFAVVAFECCLALTELNKMKWKCCNKLGKPPDPPPNFPPGNALCFYDTPLSSASRFTFLLLCAVCMCFVFVFMPFIYLSQFRRVCLSILLQFIFGFHFPSAFLACHFLRVLYEFVRSWMAIFTLSDCSWGAGRRLIKVGGPIELRTPLGWVKSGVN